MQCDIVVVGAGAAGIAAAVAAARAGAKVMLIERHAFTGGLATSALVGTICGLFYRNLNSAHFAVQGFAREFATAIQLKSQSKIAQFAEGLHFLPYEAEIFHQEALSQLLHAGVQTLLQSQVTGVSVENQRITALRVQTLSGELTLSSDAVVDCTGNAQVSLLANINQIRQASYQAGAFVFQVSGLPTKASNVLALDLIRWLKRGILSGVLDPNCERLSIIPGSLAHGVALLKLGMPLAFDGTIACRAGYEQMARQLSTIIVAYLAQNEPSLANLQITAMATEVGIRTSERGEGISLLDERQVLSCAKPEDGIAIGAWPIEYWSEARKPEMRYFDLDEVYWISARTLVSRYLDNLFFAGRALSATELAIASARVIGTCLGTGYAAGCLAAEYSRTGIWQNAVNPIRRQQIFAEGA